MNRGGGGAEGISVGRNSGNKYSGTCELGTPKGLSKTVLNSEVALFLRSISIMNGPRD